MRCTPSIKSCSKRSFRDIPPVSEELPENPFVEVHVFQGGSVVHIARSQKKIKQFSLVIDDQLKFESIEPSKGVFSFPGKILEGFMLLFSFDMTASDVSRIEKRYTSTLSQSLHFQKGGKRNTDFMLQFYKSVVGHGMGEIRLHLCSDKKIEMLQVSKRGEVEKDENRHHLTTGHGEFAVPPFLWDSFFQGRAFDYGVVFFEEFVDEIVDSTVILARIVV